MDTLLREATSSPALENVSSWKHRIRLRPFMFLQSRSTDGQVPRAPCPMAWLLAQLPSASSFQHLLTIQATEVAFHSAVSFRSFKRSPDWKHGSAFQSEKKKILLLSGSDQMDGYCLPWRQMQNNAFGEKMTTTQKGCQTSLCGHRRAWRKQGGRILKPPHQTEHSKSSVLLFLPQPWTLHPLCVIIRKCWAGFPSGLVVQWSSG